MQLINSTAVVDYVVNATHVIAYAVNDDDKINHDPSESSLAWRRRCLIFDALFRLHLLRLGVGFGPTKFQRH